VVGVISGCVDVFFFQLNLPTGTELGPTHVVYNNHVTYFKGLAVQGQHAQQEQVPPVKSVCQEVADTPHGTMAAA